MDTVHSQLFHSVSGLMINSAAAYIFLAMNTITTERTCPCAIQRTGYINTVTVGLFPTATTTFESGATIPCLPGMQSEDTNKTGTEAGGERITLKYKRRQQEVKLIGS